MHVRHGDVHGVHVKDYVVVVLLSLLLLVDCCCVVITYVVLGHYFIHVELYKYLLLINDALHAVQLLSITSHVRHYELHLMHWYSYPVMPLPLTLLPPTSIF